jgi:hypothetical protein
VTQWEELQGIATHRDFMTLLAAPKPESDVPIFMVGLPDDPFEAEATKSKFRRTVNQLRRIDSPTSLKLDLSSNQSSQDQEKNEEDMRWPCTLERLETPTPTQKVGGTSPLCTI